MLSEVVSEVTAFLEGTFTTIEAALEEQSHSLISRVAHFDCLMPRVRNSFEHFRVEFGGRHDLFNATVVVAVVTHLAGGALAVTCIV